MRTLPILAVLGLLVALGAGAWFAVQGSESAEAVGRGDTPVGPTDSTPAAEVALVAPEKGPEDPGAAPERAAVAVIEEPAETAAAAEPVAFVAGRVLDEAGRPVAGAEVALRGGDDISFLLGVGVDPDQGGRRTEAETDSAGRFRLPATTSGSKRLAVGASGFAPLHRDLHVVGGVAQDLGDLYLDRGVVLTGTVVDTAGRPIADAEILRPFQAESSGLVILRSSGPSGNALTTTDERGRFEVDQQAVGPWSLVVASEAHPEGKANGSTEQVGERVDGIEIVLEDGFEISGRVLDAPAGEDLVVRARGGSSGHGHVISEVDLEFGGGRQADVAADGSFTLRGLRGEGSYRLTVRERRGSLFTGGTRSPTVEAEPGDVGVELPYSTGAAIVFQVVDSANGLPITELEVEAGVAFRRQLRGEDGDVQTHFPEGRVRFPGVYPREAHTEGSLSVAAVGYEELERNDIALTLGEDTDLGVLRLKRIPIVRVTALDEHGSPVEGARVVLEPWKQPDGRFEMRVSRTMSSDGHDDHDVDFGHGEPRQTGRTDANGVCELSSIPGRTCTVRVVGAAQAPHESKPLELPPLGDYAYEARLAPGGSAKIHVVDAHGEPAAGAIVEHRAPSSGGPRAMYMEDQDRNRGRTDATGSVAFHHLEEGLHGFRLKEQRPGSPEMGFVTVEGMELPGSGEEWQEVAVTGGETSEVTIHASPRGNLRGTVTEAGDPLSGAKVKLLPREESPLDLGGLFGGETATRTDSAGRYTFEDVKADDYRIEVSHAMRSMPFELPIRVHEGDNKENVDLSLAIVAGTIVDSAGDPVVGVRVTAERARSSDGPQAVRMAIAVTDDGGGGETMISMGGGDQAETKTDAEGRYELRGVLADIDLVVKASGGDYEPTTSDSFHVAPDQTRTGVDFTLRKAGSIEVLAQRPDGSPASSLLVQARFAGESDSPVEPKVAFMQAGQTTLKGLMEGPWTVSLRRMQPGSEEDADAPPAQTIDVVAGEATTATFELP